jgi:exopolysaccharide production protein ExoQ
MAQWRISRRSLEGLVFGIGIFVLSGALVRIFSSGDSDLVTSGDRRYEFILALLYLAIIRIAMSHFRRTAGAFFGSPAILWLLALACASALWSELPGLVLRRTVGVVGATMFGIVLASRLSFADQLELLRRTFRIVAALSMSAWILLTLTDINLFSNASMGYGDASDSDGGAWAGIFAHKNKLGAAMALAILVERHVPAQSARSRVSQRFWFAIYAALLLLSNSATSLVAIVLTVVLMYTVRAFRSQYRLLVPTMFLTALFSGTFVLLNVGSVTGALGRSSDLTGRVDLWRWVLVMVRQRLFLGYGFSGFWKGASGQSEVVEAHIGWSPIYSHNGYLEILLSLGLAGLALFLWFVATGIRRALIRAKAAESLQDLWPLAFLVFFLAHNMGECTILWQNSLEWALAVATLVGADPRLRARRDRGEVRVTEPVREPEPEYA